MILVLASRSDASARDWAARWSDDGASLLTCADLSTPGWRYAPGRESESIAVVGGRTIPAHEIDGVLVRLPGVSEQELPHIAAADRAYVASEMSAFLIAWLSALPCPVLNRPSPSCLLGPGWRKEEWVSAAASLGIPVLPSRLRVGLDRAMQDEADSNGITLTVVGEQVLSEVIPLAGTQARQLAMAAGADLLAVHFRSRDGKMYFVSANPMVDLSSVAISAAVLQHLREYGLHAEAL